MFGPESNSLFTESVSGIIWPSAIVGAGSFWNYQSKLTPDSKEFAMMIDTQHKGMVQRGILTCPSGCKCDVLT
ncbi:hypothetical protein ABFA07_022876 [Porites harrisoni]